MGVDFMEMPNGNGFVPNVGENIEKKLQGKKIWDQEKIYVFMKREFMKATVNLGNTFFKKAKKKPQWHKKKFSRYA